MQNELISRIKNHLHYDSATGKLTWLKTTGRQVAGRPGGSPNGSGYIQIKIFGVMYVAHRLAWAMHYGVWPRLQIDHINHVRDDNRIENLREATNKENSRNVSVRRGSSLGVLGVSFNKGHGYYEAHITINRKKKHIGWFMTMDEAMSARKEAEKKLGFHENHGSTVSAYVHHRNRVAKTESTKEKIFSVASPCGKLVVGKNLSKFCKNNDLSQGNMWHLINGNVNSCKGWTRPSPRLSSLVKT